MENNFLSLLPAELLLTICDKLHLTNLKNLRLSCKFLAERLYFLVLSDIRIDTDSIKDLISHLQFLTNPPSVAVNCTTTIHIHDRKKIGDERSKDFMAVDSIPREARQKMREDLFTAFTSLKAVRTVRWSPQKIVPLWFQESIWSAIGCLPALRALYIQATFLEINLKNLNTFLALESISISGGSKCDHVATLLENVSKLYATSTNLTSIELDNISPDKFDPRRLLARRPKVDTASRLRHLAIAQIPVRIDEHMLHHFNNLTSLKLSLVGVRRLSSSPDEIWNAFRLSKIHLQELVIEDRTMGHAVNDYLSSFTGLKKLRLYVDLFDDLESLEASAVKFWSNSVLNHVGTLQDFGVCTEYYGQWCFGDHNRSVIAKCTKLKQFTISLYCSFPRRESGPEGITPLIETVLTHMPHIELLNLAVPVYRDCRLRPRLKDRILKYEPPSRFRDRFAEVEVFLDGEIVVGRK